jgi:hypothetical protein
MKESAIKTEVSMIMSRATKPEWAEAVEDARTGKIAIRELRGIKPPGGAGGKGRVGPDFEKALKSKLERVATFYIWDCLKNQNEPDLDDFVRYSKGIFKELVEPLKEKAVKEGIITLEEGNGEDSGETDESEK